MNTIDDADVPRYRSEQFGGIVALERPALLAWVDREFLRARGVPDSPRWRGAEDRDPWRPLSAPVEVHLQLTRACPNECRYCYVDAGAPLPGEWDAATFRRAIDVLAGMGVFSVALGGGESLLVPDLFDLAADARARGIIPNLTTSGRGMTAERAARCRVFGQVNVSLDALPDAAAKPGERRDAADPDRQRGAGAGAQARAALELLVAAGVRTGINCVLTRESFETLEPLVAFAAARGLADVELLRYKPAGRAASDDYYRHRLTSAQARALGPEVRRLQARYGCELKIDCSLVPFIAASDPDPAHCARLGMMGCDGGNFLASADPSGRVSGCSFTAPPSPAPPPSVTDGGAATAPSALTDGGVDLFDLPARWADAPELVRFRDWRTRAPAPCRTCEYFSLCKGGCHAVASFVAGDFFAPDPECPRVIDFRAGGGS